MKKRLMVLLGILIAVFALGYAWWTQAIRPVNPQDLTLVSFTIESGADSRTIAEALHKKELIRSTVAFFLLSRFFGYAPRFQAGDFQLSPSMDLTTIANRLTKGMTDTTITIPEGWRSEEIAMKIAKELNIPEKEFLKNAREGYLFPDTYQIPKNASAAGVADIMNREFYAKIDPSLIAQAQARGLTLESLIIIASLVEREAKHDSDRPIVASVILNRLNQDMPLDLDATIQYALGYQDKEKTWWKKDLTLEDLQINHPYNTYQNPGLPPGPISNPGLEAIQAVIDAPETDYLFYISDSNGTIHPAKTLEEHNANISQYLSR